MLEAETRQAAIALLLAELQVDERSAVVEPSRTMVRIDERLWTLVRATSPREGGLSASQRRGGAKHKSVR